MQRLHLSESQHGTLSSPEWQVAVLDPVVGPASDLALLVVPQLVHRGAVGAKAIGGDRFRRTVAFERLLHEGEGGCFVALFGDKAFENLAFLVDRAPQVPYSAILTSPIGAIPLTAPCLGLLHSLDSAVSAAKLS